MLQAILNALDFDMTVAEAVSRAPLLRHQRRHRRDQPHPDRGDARELGAMGYEVVRSPQTYGFAAVHAHPDRTATASTAAPIPATTAS